MSAFSIGRFLRNSEQHRKADRTNETHPAGTPSLFDEPEESERCADDAASFGTNISPSSKNSDQDADKREENSLFEDLNVIPAQTTRSNSLRAASSADASNVPAKPPQPSESAATELSSDQSAALEELPPVFGSRKKLLPEELRAQAVKLFQAGLGYKSVAARLGIATSTVRDWGRAYRKGTFTIKPKRADAQHTDAERLQVLKLRAQGLSWKQIEELTGIHAATCWQWGQKAEALLPRDARLNRLFNQSTPNLFQDADDAASAPALRHDEKDA